MIRIELVASPATAPALKPVLEYVTEKMAGERADSHDTATAAYVILRKLRDAAVRRGEGSLEVWVSNEFGRATCRELSMFLGFASERPEIETFLVRRLRDLLDDHIKRQDSEKWARERDRIAKGRPTVREARKRA